MVAQAYVEEAAGWPVRVYRVGVINIVAYDVPAPSEGDRFAMSISPGPGGSPGYSYERWFRLSFGGGFTTVRNLQFSTPGLVLPDDWDIRFGTAATYQRPSNHQSKIAVAAPPFTPVSIGNGPYTPPAHSLWIVLQARVNRDSMAALDMQFQFSYAED